MNHSHLMLTRSCVKILMIMTMIMVFLLIPWMPLPNTFPRVALPSHPRRMSSDIIFQLTTSSLFPTFLARNNRPMLSRSACPVLCSIFHAEAGPRIRENFLIHGPFKDQVFFFHLFDEIRKQTKELGTVFGICGENRFEGFDLT